MKNLLAKKTATPTFQVLLLDNDDSDDVTVHEAQKVDYSRVKEHLSNGGSVFITSKSTQKISVPKKKLQTKYAGAQRNYGILLKTNLRASKNG